MFDLYNISIWELALATTIAIGIYAIWEDGNK